MKRLAVYGGLLAFVAVLPLSHVFLSAGPPAQNFRICHKGHVIAVSAQAAQTHITKHSDTDCLLGAPEGLNPGDECGCDCGEPGQPACSE